MNKGAVLKNLIKKSNLTQRQVANELGLHENYLGVLLKNSDLKDSFILQICSMIGVDSSQHFSIKDTGNSLMQHFEVLQDRYDKLSHRYDSLQEKHLSETNRLLEQTQQLIQENHNLKNDIHVLKEEILELKKK